MRQLRGVIAATALCGMALATVATPATAATGGPTGSCPSPAGSLTSLPVHTHCTITASTSGSPITDIQLRITRPSDVAHPVTAASFSPGTSSYTIDSNYTISSNGHYHLTVSASEDDGVLGGGSHSGTPVDQFFDLDVPPAPPANVKATVQSDRATVVTWDPNKEPDLQGYAIQRADAGSSTWVQIGSLGTDVQPPKFRDSTTPTDAGGSYRYRVFALRSSSDQNPDPTKRVLIQSNPSDEAKVSVPAGVTGSGGSGGSGSGGTGTGTGTSSGGSSASSSGGGSVGGSSSSGSPALATAGKVDLSQFAALLDKARKSNTPPTEADPGFGQTLPFKPGSPGADAEDGAGQQTLGSGSSEGQVAGIDVSTALPFVAGSLLLTVLLMHVLYVRAEVRRADALEALTPADGDGSAAGDGSGPLPSADDVPAAV